MFWIGFIVGAWVGVFATVTYWWYYDLSRLAPWEPKKRKDR